MEIPEGAIYAAGPVIIENGKVLLDRKKKNSGASPWLFPGGKVESGESLEETARREVKEELGIEIEIIRPLRTLVKPGLSNPHHTYILAHFLAKRIGEINPGDDIAEWGWHDIHHLPDNCAPNVREIINDIIKKNL